jgi:mono/diheme cytochrome c family protein
MKRIICVYTLGISLLGSGALAAAEPDEPALQRRFAEVVQPFLKNHCLGCHGPEKRQGKLDLSVYTSLEAVAKNTPVWDLVQERLEAEEMPPEKAPRQPLPHERRAVIDWIATVHEHEAQRNAGDPGVVLARRLSNAELDYTIRDLTGVDMRPTREFPVDPANEAGFDNSGQSLTMSPALVKKYLAAARLVADHLVLKPDGVDFAPHPVVTDTDRDKYCVARIVAFYNRHRVDYADYFLAAWRFQHRSALGKPDAPLSTFASEAGLSARYLASVWAILEEPWPESGPAGKVQALWRGLPEDATKQDEARRGCERMRDLVITLRRELVPSVRKMQVRGISPGSQPFVLWRNRQLAAQRMLTAGDALARDIEEFCRVFPDAFFLSERPPYFDAKASLRGRLLTAGFHLMQGYFRDDAPLCALVLGDAERHELDALWQELDFVTLVPIRQYKDFPLFLNSAF